MVFNFKNRLRIFDTRVVLRKIFWPKGSGKDHITSFMICTAHQILLG